MKRIISKYVLALLVLSAGAVHGKVATKTANLRRGLQASSVSMDSVSSDDSPDVRGRKLTSVSVDSVSSDDSPDSSPDTRGRKLQTSVSVDSVSSDDSPDSSPDTRGRKLQTSVTMY
jgi:hypothetical protein